MLVLYRKRLKCRSVAVTPPIRLPAPPPWQSPQSVRRKYEGEERGHADRDQRPDKEEGSAGIGDSAPYADTPPTHVDDGDDHPKERQEEGDDVPRSPFGEHQRCVQPNDNNGHSDEV